MLKPLIVIVEDDEEQVRLLAVYLERFGMRTQTFTHVQQALQFFKHNLADLLLLDVNLPDQSGFDLAGMLRSTGNSIPIIFLTGNAGDAHKVCGLKLGDDYVTKPFNYAELVARIRAVLRRIGGSADCRPEDVRKTEPFAFCGAQIIPLQGAILFHSDSAVPEKIGSKELGILTYLHAHPGEVIPRKTLIHSIWGIHADVKSRSLDQYVVKIRNLFSSRGLNPSAFRTVHGIGYIFDPEGIFPDRK